MDGPLRLAETSRALHETNEVAERHGGRTMPGQDAAAFDLAAWTPTPLLIRGESRRWPWPTVSAPAAPTAKP
jgi:hypothetical protein